MIGILVVSITISGLDISDRQTFAVVLICLTLITLGVLFLQVIAL